jgi:hypothetical protein
LEWTACYSSKECDPFQKALKEHTLDFKRVLCAAIFRLWMQEENPVIAVTHFLCWSSYSATVDPSMGRGRNNHWDFPENINPYKGIGLKLHRILMTLGLAFAKHDERKTHEQVQAVVSTP